ncbi:MAG: cytochrome P460 family protein [Bacteroidota bacterium]|jgi:hypothetical protein
MRNKQKIIVTMFFSLATIWTINSCKKEKEAEGVDKELYEMSKTTSGFMWYKNTSTLLNKSSGSAHPQSLLRTRYNAIAASKLDSNGKIQAGAIFPEGALIVKELHDNSTTLARYAILYKKSGSTDADAKGWVWGYINADGTVVESASKKGSSCISCHSQADNIDYMLMNKYFP